MSRLYGLSREQERLHLVFTRSSNSIAPGPETLEIDILWWGGGSALSPRSFLNLPHFEAESEKL